MSYQDPLVSIIMNCYNSDKFLKEAIDSVYAQSYQNWEIIFWDNNSSDNTATIAKQLWKEFGSAIPLNVIFERTPGLSHAPPGCAGALPDSCQ